MTPRIFIFLLPLVVGLSVLMFCLYKTKYSEIKVTNGAPIYNKKHCFKYSGEKPSSEEAEEERRLLDLIAWPDPPTQLKATTPQQTSDPTKSTFTILPAGGDGEWHVGDQLEAVIHMHDFQGRRRLHGGDFLVARLHSPKLLAGVVGQVLDHSNGSYSAVFPLLWEGSAQVEVTLIHPYEAVSVLRRVREEHPDRIFFHSLFRHGSRKEVTECNRCLPPNQPLCNYTDVLTGEPWFCYKPKLLDCDARFDHYKGGERFANILTQSEKDLFRSHVNLKVLLQALGHHNIDVMAEKKDFSEKSSLKPKVPAKVMTSGYYFQGTWRTLGGLTVRQFNDNSIIQCLWGKEVHFYGDSTIRQWYIYLRGHAGIREFNLHSPYGTGPFLAVDNRNNIMLTFRSHSHPLRHQEHTAAIELHYIPNELDQIAGGANTAVIIGVWAHFSLTPKEIFIRRLRQIRRSLVRLLDRAPDTTVVIRSSNLQKLDLNLSLVNSDWYNLEMNHLIKAMFKGLDVLVVDAWDMSLASHLPHDLHPPPPIIKDMMDQVLSYMCS